MYGDGNPPRLRTCDYVDDSGRPALRVFRHVLREAGETHWHEFFELAFVISGTGRHRCNGREWHLAPNDVFLLTPADVHSVDGLGAEPLILIDVVFTPAALSPGAQGLLVRWPPSTGAQLPRPLPRLRPDVERLWTEEGTTDLGREQVQQATLERVLMDVLRAAGEERHTASSGGTERIRHVVGWLDQSFAQPVTLAEAAAQAGYSASHFSARFRQVTGSSFQTYLMRRRLDFARSLLAMTQAAITEVSNASGFRTLSHFERAFRQRYRQSPREWRATVGSANHGANHHPDHDPYHDPYDDPYRDHGGRG